MLLQFGALQVFGDVDGGLNPPLFGAGCLPVRFCQCWPLVGRGTSTEVGDAELKVAFPLSMLLSC
jgi:hypothetical protein